MDLMTIDVLKKATPKALRNRIDESTVDLINNISNDEVFRDLFRDNFLSYMHIIQDGKYKMPDYLNAVKYVSYKLMGSSNLQAYTKTFPERIDRLVTEGSTDKDISAYVAAYNKNQLVNKIIEQAMVPTHILNADLFQKAINAQAELMLTAKSEKVRSDAANSLLIHLKPPVDTKIKLDIGIQNDSLIEDLRKTTAELAAQQKRLIESGIVNTKDIAESNIIEGELIDE